MEAPANANDGESQYVLLLRNLVKVVKQAPKAYTDWVEKNPEQASKLETVVRVLGYIIPGTYAVSSGSGNTLMSPLATLVPPTKSSYSVLSTPCICVLDLHLSTYPVLPINQSINQSISNDIVSTAGGRWRCQLDNAPKKD